MNLMANPTVKSALSIAAITIGAVALFVGPEESKGILAETATNASYDDADMELEISAQEDAPRETVIAPEDQEDDTAEIVEWDDDELIDSAEGFDPDPYSDGEAEFDTSSDDEESGYDPEPEVSTEPTSDASETSAEFAQPEPADLASAS